MDSGPIICTVETLKYLLEHSDIFGWYLQDSQLRGVGADIGRLFASFCGLEIHDIRI